MKKLFEIKLVKNPKRKKKYPYKIKFSDGRVIPLPSQYNFDNSSYIRSKGCIIAAFYMALRFVGIKKSMTQCLKFLQDNYSKGNHKNYNLENVCKAINQLVAGNPAKFYKKITKGKMKKSPESRAYGFIHGEESNSYGSFDVEWEKVHQIFQWKIQNGHSGSGNPQA